MSYSGGTSSQPVTLWRTRELDWDPITTLTRQTFLIRNFGLRRASCGLPVQLEFLKEKEVYIQASSQSTSKGG
jgi:hypothetical protein